MEIFACKVLFLKHNMFICIYLKFSKQFEICPFKFSYFCLIYIWDTPPTAAANNLWLSSRNSDTLVMKPNIVSPTFWVRFVKLWVVPDPFNLHTVSTTLICGTGRSFCRENTPSGNFLRLDIFINEEWTICVSRLVLIN